MLLSSGGESGAHTVADRLSSVLKRPMVIHGEPFLVHASVGIAVGAGSVDSMCDDLLAQADMAMYAAKSARSSNAAVYRAEMREHVAPRR